MKRSLIRFSKVIAVGALWIAPLMASISINQQTELGGDGPDFATNISPTSDGGYVACGVNGLNNRLNYSVVKLSASGAVTWERTFSVDNVAEKAYSVEETADGGFIVIGSALILNAQNPGSASRPWLLKLDANGDVVWTSENTFTQTLNVKSGIVLGTELADGTFVAAGGTNTISSFQDAWLLRVDSAGHQIGFDTYPPFIQGFGQGTYLSQVEATPDGGFVIVGSAGPPLGQAFLWKFNAQAEEEWVRLFPLQQGGFRNVVSVRNAAGGGYFLTSAGGANGNTALLAQVDSAGDLLWQRSYPDPGGDYTNARDVLQRPGGNLLLLQTRTDAVGAQDIKSDILTLAPDGTLLGTTPLAIGSEATSLERLVAGTGDAFAAVGFSRNASVVNGTDFLIINGTMTTNPNNIPPVALNDTFAGVEDETLEISAPGVLQNDTDSDGDPINAQLVDPPPEGWLNLLPDGSFVYTPRTGFSGDIQFTYRVVDGQALGNLGTATISIPDTIQHQPSAYSDTYQIFLDQSLNISAPGVLDNDIDVDGDSLTASLVQGTANGVLNFNSDGSFSYVPNTGYTGTDTFTYTVSDGFISSSEAIVAIEVGPFLGLSLAWSRDWGETGADTLQDVNPTGYGGLITAGSKNYGFQQSGYISRTDDVGQDIWTYRFDLGGTGGRAYRAEQTQDGGFVGIGSAVLSGSFDFRPFVVKLDASGNEVWSSANSFSQTLELDSAIVVGAELPDGRIAIAGGNNTNTNPQEPWIAIVAANGDLLDFELFDPLVPGFGQGTYINDMVATPDGGFALAGNAGSPPGQGFLWKFSAAGDEEWVQLYPLNSDGFRSALAVRNAMGGGYFMTGCGGVNCTDSLAVKADTTGNILWAKTYEDPGGQYTNSMDIIERSDGTLLLTQTRFDGFGATDQDSDVLELAGDGTLVSRRQIPGGDRATVIQRLKATRNGAGFLMAGYITENGQVSNSAQFYLAANAISEQVGVFACPDFNGDGRTNAADIGILVQNWETHGDLGLDMDGDGRLAISDLVKLVSSQGMCP